MLKKVLIVDDSRTARLIAKEALSSEFDCQVFEARNGLQGLLIAQAQLPDLILLDITMDVMNGEEMLEQLNADPQLKDIPVIMLTAISDRNSVIRSVKLGAKAYIKKPFTAQQLIDSVKQVM